MNLRVLSALAASLVLGALAVESASAAYPGRNGRIAFTHQTPAGTNDIYTVRRDGTVLRRLTGSPVDDIQPAWSPDGTAIAFASRRQGNWDIYVMNADGSGVRRLTHDPGSDFSPTWSPDGRHIAFVSGGALYRVRASRSGRTRIARGDVGDPAWSPTGRWIAFVRETDIWLIHPDGTALRRLTNHPGFGCFAPSWSPRGLRIAFVRVSPELERGIYVVNRDGTGERRIPGTEATLDAAGPAWSPDGRRIAFPHASPREIFTIRVDGTASRRVTRLNGLDYAPDWQPLPYRRPLAARPTAALCHSPCAPVPQ